VTTKEAYEKRKSLICWDNPEEPTIEGGTAAEWTEWVACMRGDPQYTVWGKKIAKYLETQKKKLNAR